MLQKLHYCLSLVSWLYIKFREPPSDSSQCIEAVKETAAAATAWAKKVIVLQADGTGMDSEIVDTSVATVQLRRRLKQWLLLWLQLRQVIAIMKLCLGKIQLLVLFLMKEAGQQFH